MEITSLLNPPVETPQSPNVVRLVIPGTRQRFSTKLSKTQEHNHLWPLVRTAEREFLIRN